MTWNVAGVAVSASSTTTGMTEQVASAAKSLGADFVCLQEVGYQQFLDIQARLGAWAKTAVFAAQSDTASAGQPYGIALFSQYVTTNTTTTSLGAADSFGELRKMLSVKWGDYRIACIHTAIVTENAAQLEVARTTATAWRNAGDKVIIAGDFNSRWDQSGMTPWLTAWREADDTNPGGMRGKIDLVVHAGTSFDTFAEVIYPAQRASTSTGKASDHSMIVADLNRTIGGTMATLAAQISTLAVAVRTKFNAVNTLIKGNAADLSSLPTANKASLLDAIKEIAGGVWTNWEPDSTYNSQGGAPNRYRVDNGFVTLDINLKRVDAGTFATADVTLNSTTALPAAIRPSTSLNLQINTNGAVARLVINSSGQIIYRGAGLASVSFVVGQVVYRI